MGFPPDPPAGPTVRTGGPAFVSAHRRIPSAFGFLKMGGNVLAVYGDVEYQQGEKTGQVDVPLEGLKEKDLIPTPHEPSLAEIVATPFP